MSDKNPRGLIHGRNVPPPYTVACLHKLKRRREYALGHRYGVFRADPSRVERVLVASFVTELEAYEHAWGLVERLLPKPAQPEVDEDVERMLRAAREEAGARCM